jgi:hypothetical protein
VIPATPALLLSRLDEIGASLARSGKALALIGLGSVGLELDRLDRYSALDFFAIVENGHKRELLDDLSWLGGIRPIAYSFRNDSQRPRGGAKNPDELGETGQGMTDRLRRGQPSPGTATSSWCLGCLQARSSPRTSSASWFPSSARCYPWP